MHIFHFGAKTASSHVLKMTVASKSQSSLRIAPAACHTKHATNTLGSNCFQCSCSFVKCFFIWFHHSLCFASLLCSEGFFSPVFPSPQKLTVRNSNSILECTGISERVLACELLGALWVNKLHIHIFTWIYIRYGIQCIIISSIWTHYNRLSIKDESGWSWSDGGIRRRVGSIFDFKPVLLVSFKDVYIVRSRGEIVCDVKNLSHTRSK